MEVLRYASAFSADVLADVDKALRAAELEAVATAEPTPGAADVMRHVSDRGIPLVIVSNNSSPAIRRYLDDHDLTQYVRGVVGRSFGRPDLMKPDPSPLIRGIELIGSRTSGCVIIGDSVARISRPPEPPEWQASAMPTGLTSGEPLPMQVPTRSSAEC